MKFYHQITIRANQVYCYYLESENDLFCDRLMVDKVFIERLNGFKVTFNNCKYVQVTLDYTEVRARPNHVLQMDENGTISEIKLEKSFSANKLVARNHLLYCDEMCAKAYPFSIIEFRSKDISISLQEGNFIIEASVTINVRYINGDIRLLVVPVVPVVLETPAVPVAPKTSKLRQWFAEQL